MQDLLFTLNAVAPAFLIILLGIVLKKIKIINDDFISISSKIVFNIALPSLIFIKIAQTNFHEIAKFDEIAFGCIGIFICFIVSFIISIFIKDPKKKGVFIQGAFRGNYAIIGFAILYNIFGDVGLSRGAIILAFALPIFNIFSIVALILPMYKFDKEGAKKILIKIITNPNIIAVALAIPFSIYEITLNDVFIKTFNNLSAITLPLALIGIGGSLSISKIKENLFLVLSASFLKILIFPLIFTYAAYLFGFQNESLVALFILFSVPTAVTSFIFAKALEGDTKLAANVVFLTTVGSVFTISLGIFILKSAGMIY